MNTKFTYLLIMLMLLDCINQVTAQGTAFTYQGRLNNNGTAVTGSYDLTFTLFSTNASGTAIAVPITNKVVAVTSGLFTTLIDFGPGIFTGTSNWLEVAVSTNGANNFTVLSPRQQITPAPYAITAQNLASVIMNNNVGGGDTVGGGFNNSASNFNSTISGGANNAAAGNASTVGGGSENGAMGDHTVVGGGQNNLNNGNHATISGGYYNYIDTNVTYSFIGGGIENTDLTSYAVIGGGQLNTLAAYSQHSVIGGGGQNSIETNSEWATISGGAINTILSPYGSYAAISGGYDNRNGGYASVIAGGELNSILNFADDSAISGGANNLIIGSQLENVYSTIGGGVQNQIQTNTTYATIGGGGFNQIQADASLSTIAGGYYNQIQSTASESTISGGGGNQIQTNAYDSTIGGGYQNVIQPNTQDATIAGGYQNFILPNASFSTIPGGYSNVIGGSYSFAAGQQAQALHQGTFVWADTQAPPFSSTANNEFLVRAAGGVGINMNNPNGASLYVQGNRAGGTFSSSVGFFENTSTATGAAGSSPALRVICDGGNNPAGALSVSANGTGPIAEFGNGNTFVASIENDGTIKSKGVILTSDRNAKENFSTLDGKAVLAKVISLRVTEWNYKDDAADKRHIGPMAQDFHAAFQLDGPDDKHIAVVDEGGVALVAIQGLNQKVEEKDAEIRELKLRLVTLEKIVLNQKPN